MMREASNSLRIILASDGDEPDQMKMIVREKLANYPFVLSANLGISHAVGKLPYAVLIGVDGKVVAKGLVNNREHLESLFEAERTGVASIQDYMARRNAGQG
jgi:methylamine dehydrogenase accessory protein MauD